MTLEIGSVVEGVITGITSFGAFVRLPKGNRGLIHISEIADSYVKDINEFLSVKDKVNVKVLKVNSEGKYDLSLKQAEQPPKENESGDETTTAPQHISDEVDTDKTDKDYDEAEDADEEDSSDSNSQSQSGSDYHRKDRGHGFSGKRGRKGFGRKSPERHTFEDKISRFMKESEERLLDLKRNTEAKRGRGKGR